MSVKTWLVLATFGALVWLTLRTASTFDTLRRQLVAEGKHEGAALALGVLLAGAAVGFEQLWWFAFQWGNAIGLDLWWMQAHKFTLTPLAVLACAGYSIHLRSVHAQRGEPGAWKVEAAMAAAFGVGMATVAAVLSQ